MTSDERFGAALRDLDDTLASVEAESFWVLHPWDRLRAVAYGDQAARMRVAWSRGDAVVRANLARSAEDLAQEARHAFTVVLNTPATPSPSIAASAPTSHPWMDSAYGTPASQIIAGGLVAVGVVSGAMILGSAIRAIGGLGD